MSDIIKHECGVALIRLLKPISFYKTKYGSARYGLHKMYQIMEKMINRGQDGAGISTVKLNAKPGTTYIDRLRSIEPKATQDIFSQVNELFVEAQKKKCWVIYVTVLLEKTVFILATLSAARITGWRVI
jgi:amidophosphoribosyltransferase